MRVTVFVGTVKGAFLLHGDGEREQWTVEGPLFKGWKVTSVAQGRDGETLAATASDVYGAGIHRSTNLREWKAVQSVPAYSAESGYKLKQLWTLTPSHGRWFAGVDEAGLFQSDDDGDHWHLVQGLTDHPTRGAWQRGLGGLCCHAVITHPDRSERLWCGISAVGVFRSDDGGAQWKACNEGVPAILEDRDHPDIGYCVHSLCIDPEHPDVLYRQDHVGMFRSDNGGDTWERTEQGLPSGFGFPLVLDRRGRQLFAIPLESDEYRVPVDGKLCVARSRDGGREWQILRQGLPENNFFGGVLRGAMATDHLDPAGIYFGTTAGSIHYSHDSGEHWSALPVTFPRVLCVEVFVEGQPWRR